MKHILTLIMSIIFLATLPACWCKNKTCQTKPQKNQQEEEKRISGPLSEKEVGWDEGDLK